MINERILIIGAHPDDEVLGCGGIINRFYKNNKIHVLVLGEGSTCREGDQNNNINFRQQASIKAINLLSNNTATISFGSGICGSFKNQPVKLLKGEIENTINNFNPTVIFSHYYNDNNLDHTTVYNYVRIVTRPYIKNNIHSVYLYEVASSSDRGGFSPNSYFKLSLDNISAKTQAMSYFTTEQEYPQRTSQGITILAQYRGNHIGENFAESFILEHSIL